MFYKRQRGSLLLEQIATILIVSIGFMGLFALFSTIMRNQNFPETEYQAIQMGRCVMQVVLNQSEIKDVDNQPLSFFFPKIPVDVLKNYRATVKHRAIPQYPKLVLTTVIISHTPTGRFQLNAVRAIHHE